MSLFAANDQANLVAPPATFDAQTYGRGAYASNTVRSALALEVTAQLVKRGASFNYRGGTPLQTRLQWPPARASNDNDYDTTNAADLRAVIDQFVTDFSATQITVREVESDYPGFKLDLSFPGVDPPLVLRIDALELEALPSSRAPWPMPGPWNAVTVPSAVTHDATAAAKLLLAADPPFGRNVVPPEADRGRKSRIKDLYDLVCLGALPLNGNNILSLVSEEVARKSAYMGQTYQLQPILQQAKQGLRFFTAPRAVGDSQWRAFTRIRQTIRDAAFEEVDLRIAAGCAHNALHQIQNGTLDWADAWLPYNQRTQTRTTGSNTLPAGVQFSPADQGLAGLVESWTI